ncbi:MAG: sugar ABC transporter permease [Oscillospiraceae bacterium]|jgi:putative multiple sugar transport system permease protein|nr:sugar ABC transporter permease [Oscillospiraceae bacterium]
MKNESLEKIQRLLSGNIRQYGMVLALFIVIVLFQILTNGILLMPLNVSNIIQQNAYVMILACGMMLCILTGGNIDLSVGSVAGFVGAVSAVFVLRMGMPTVPAIFISLLIGLLIGAWHGFWIAYVGVPAFIATLAGMLFFRGLTLAILQGVSLAPMPSDYSFIAAGFVADTPGPGDLMMVTVISGIVLSIIFVAVQLLARKKRQSYDFDVPHIALFLAQLAIVCFVINFFTLRLAQHRGLPMVLTIVAVLVLVYSFITNRTVFGRQIYAFGGNKMAARLSGINTKRVMFLVYANMGLLAALAGIIFTGRLNSATPKAGDGFELDAIAACFIGGASTTGGVGTIIGAIIGGMLMGVLNNGMAILGISIDWQQAVKGMVLLFAVAFDVLSKRNKAT